jgi:hypothetical protein
MEQLGRNRDSTVGDFEREEERNEKMMNSSSSEVEPKQDFLVNDQSILRFAIEFLRKDWFLKVALTWIEISKQKETGSMKAIEKATRVWSGPLGDCPRVLQIVMRKVRKEIRDLNTAVCAETDPSKQKVVDHKARQSLLQETTKVGTLLDVAENTCLGMHDNDELAYAYSVKFIVMLKKMNTTSILGISNATLLIALFRMSLDEWKNEVKRLRGEYLHSSSFYGEGAVMFYAMAMASFLEVGFCKMLHMLRGIGTELQRCLGRQQLGPLYGDWDAGIDAVVTSGISNEHSISVILGCCRSDDLEYIDSCVEETRRLVDRYPQHTATIEDLWRLLNDIRGLRYLTTGASSNEGIAVLDLMTAGQNESMLIAYFHNALKNTTSNDSLFLSPIQEARSESLRTFLGLLANYCNARGGIQYVWDAMNQPVADAINECKRRGHNELAIALETIPHMMNSRSDSEHDETINKLLRSYVDCFCVY